MLVDIKVLDKKLKKIEKLENFPKYETNGSAGFDLRICVENSINLKPNDCQLIGTGIAIHLKDNNYAAMILPRSGMGHKGIILGNSIGLIDSDYQGEIKLSIWNRSLNEIILNPLDRIAQLIIIPVIQAKFNIVDNFDEITIRGARGYGSTGKN